MKANKTLSHSSLITETISLLSNIFKPTHQLIEAEIETLIGKDYLTRDEKDKTLYNYVS